MNIFTNTIISLTSQKVPKGLLEVAEGRAEAILLPNEGRSSQGITERREMTYYSRVFSHLILIHEVLSIRLKLNLNILLICSALFMKIIVLHTLR